MEYEIVYGDSYAEGAGDEFLKRDINYGLFKKLAVDADRRFIIFGRGGYGSLGTRIEEERCSLLINNYTAFSYDDSQIKRITFIFYEGNDLSDNLKEKNRPTFEMRYKTRFFLPIVEYSYERLVPLLWKFIRQSFGRSNIRESQSVNTRSKPTSDAGVRMRRYPESAVELSESELVVAFSILENSLSMIQKKFPSKKLQLLYVPAVASSYNFTGDILVKSKQSDQRVYLTSGEKNRMRHEEIRAKVKNLSTKIGWQFCDSTETILAYTEKGAAVHGPRDWDHLNKEGYKLLKDVYLNCFPPEIIK